LTHQDQIIPDPIILYQTRPDHNRPNQAMLNKTRHTISNQTLQIRTDHTRPNQTTSNMTRPYQTKSDHFKYGPTIPDPIRLRHTWPYHTRPN